MSTLRASKIFVYQYAESDVTLHSDIKLIDYILDTVEDVQPENVSMVNLNIYSIERRSK